MTHELDGAIASVRGDDGSHVVQVTGDWHTPNETPNGGYILALVLRAMQEESPLPDPLSVSITYLRPPAVGEAVVEVETIRTGRRVVTLSATLRQGDKVAVHAVASFHDADATGAHQHTPHTPPPLPSPDECTDLHTALPDLPIPILQRLDVRYESLPGWMSGSPTGVTEGTWWVRLRDGRPTDALAAALLVDAAPPVTGEIGVLASATIQLTVYFRRRPEAGWVQSHIVTRHVIDGYHDEDVELWDEQGRLVAQSRQIAILS